MSARDTSGSAPQHSHPHNNTMRRNEKFWVDQVTVPHPPPPGERQGVGNDKGGGGYHTQRAGEAYLFFGGGSSHDKLPELAHQKALEKSLGIKDQGCPVLRLSHEAMW